MSKLFSIYFAALFITLVSCSNNSSTETATNNEKKDSMNITEDKVEYSLDTVKMIGYVAYDANKQGRRPVVLVVHEWWGLTDYPRMRAKKLAELGYLALAVALPLFLLPLRHGPVWPRPGILPLRGRPGGRSDPGANPLRVDRP